MITGPGGISVSGNCAGFGTPLLLIATPAINGTFQVSVTSSVDYVSTVGFNVTWLDPAGWTQFLAGYEMSFYFGGTKTATFNFSKGIDPPPPPPQDNIKISMVGEKSIWPELPQDQSHIEGYKPRTNIKVKATNGNLPIANQNVKIFITRIEGTGGHDHTSPALEPFKSGTIKVNSVRSNPQIVTTDNNGEYTTEEILASEFGGEYIIEAALVSKPTIKDTVHITVKVPELAELELNTSIYELVGTAENHSLTNDPCRVIPPNSKHYSNHFGTQNLIAALINISSEYNKKNPSIRLRVNDMGLKYGGLFDWKNNWEHPHKLHRLGKNADVGFTGIDKTNKCTSLSKRFLYKLIQDITQIIPLEESDHFHVYTW